MDLWQEALKYLGWSRADIEGLLDEEQYLGVPDLFTGELEFRSRAENREEFLQIIANGGYVVGNEIIMSLPTYLGMSFSDACHTIQNACRAFQMKSTPGSWRENEVVNIVLGVDYWLWGFGGVWESYTAFEEYDKR